LVGSSDS